MRFSDLKLNTPLLNALDDLGYDYATPIQAKAFPVISSGRDVVGIAQTGTGKTYAYLLPLLKQLKYSEQKHPRVLIIVPTRELVVQVEEALKELTPYINTRIGGVYGGANINTQKQLIFEGLDILVATPGRIIDLGLSKVLNLKKIQKLVLDEVDEVLNLGFRHQLETILDLLPEKKQSILFSATMTDEVKNIINTFFRAPLTVEIERSGTPLENIEQRIYEVKNFYTKVNLLRFLLSDKDTFSKALVFTKNKRVADKLFAELENSGDSEGISVIHSNKSQNYRLQAIKGFQEGLHRILIATDVLARGIDIEGITHVINFDITDDPENYIHRIGRTGRAENEGNAISFVTENDQEILENVEALMDLKVAIADFPEEVEISSKMTEEEMPVEVIKPYQKKKSKEFAPGPAFHEKKEKNRKTNQGGSYRRELAKKYKKPKTRGQKRK
ncbi:DEAD/DEAH box helicase [Flavicella sp.]|uniref:DEAD/DEAH box helicase n=1 Tax=Flavicella sp. TaxID=2957742 RepID=UPI00261A1C5B|nr:DEAD/DEAH box helicase [Flavicella sp.]MDG1803990.1 DEAD/DEAH box helicase [Flavicella sp.]MDG2280616.1 DEAD/DEAH box helicase [Flavicella sp.]